MARDRAKHVPRESQRRGTAKRALTAHFGSSAIQRWSRSTPHTSHSRRAGDAGNYEERWNAPRLGRSDGLRYELEGLVPENTRRKNRPTIAAHHCGLFFARRDRKHAFHLLHPPTKRQCTPRARLRHQCTREVTSQAVFETAHCGHANCPRHAQRCTLTLCVTVRDQRGGGRMLPPPRPIAARAERTPGARVTPGPGWQPLEPTKSPSTGVP